VNTDFYRYHVMRALFLAGIISDPVLAHAALSVTGKPGVQSVGSQDDGLPGVAGGKRGNSQSLYANHVSSVVTAPGALLVSRRRDTTGDHAPAIPGAQGSVNVGEVNAASGRRAPHSARKRQFTSSTAKTIVDRAQIETRVPPGGSIVHALAAAPGVQIRRLWFGQRRPPAIRSALTVFRSAGRYRAAIPRRMASPFCLTAFP